MFSHFTFGTSDLQRAIAFYDLVVLPLGLKRRNLTPDGGPPSAQWVLPDRTLSRFYVCVPFNGKLALAGNGGMVAFLASSASCVKVVFHAGLAAGAVSEGAPGERLRYGQGYYGAYSRDPDENKIHIVYRGDLPSDANLFSHCDHSILIALHIRTCFE